MEIPAVTIQFAEEKEAPSLAVCLEQLLCNLGPVPAQED